MWVCCSWLGIDFGGDAGDALDTYWFQGRHKGAFNWFWGWHRGCIGPVFFYSWNLIGACSWTGTYWTGTYMMFPSDIYRMLCSPSVVYMGVGILHPVLFSFFFFISVSFFPCDRYPLYLSLICKYVSICISFLKR